MSAHFDLQPTLRGELLVLRPLQVADIDALFAAASDASIWEQHPDRDRYRREVFEQFFAGAMASRGAFAIIDRKTGAIIGSSRYCNLKEAAREVEIGWTFLERAYWGGIYNRELKRLMLDHAFASSVPDETGPIATVVFVVGENNLRSQKALAKIGAKFLGTLQRPGGNGILQGNVIYAIRDYEWVSGKRGSS